MKKFNWVKLPDRELNQNPSALWVKLQGSASTLKVNLDHLEEQFGQKQVDAKSAEADKKPAKVPVAMHACMH